MCHAIDEGSNTRNELRTQRRRARVHEKTSRRSVFPTRCEHLYALVCEDGWKEKVSEGQYDLSRSSLREDANVKF